LIRPKNMQPDKLDNLSVQLPKWGHVHQTFITQNVIVSIAIDLILAKT